MKSLVALLDARSFEGTCIKVTIFKRVVNVDNRATLLQHLPATTARDLEAFYKLYDAFLPDKLGDNTAFLSSVHRLLQTYSAAITAAKNVWERLDREAAAARNAAAKRARIAADEEKKAKYIQIGREMERVAQQNGAPPTHAILSIEECIQAVTDVLAMLGSTPLDVSAATNTLEKVQEYLQASSNL